MSYKYIITIHPHAAENIAAKDAEKSLNTYYDGKEWTKVEAQAACYDTMELANEVLIDAGKAFSKMIVSSFQPPGYPIWISIDNLFEIKKVIML